MTLALLITLYILIGAVTATVFLGVTENKDHKELADIEGVAFAYALMVPFWPLIFAIGIGFFVVYQPLRYLYKGVHWAKMEAIAPKENV